MKVRKEREMTEGCRQHQGKKVQSEDEISRSCIKVETPIQRIFIEAVTQTVSLNSVIDFGIFVHGPCIKERKK
jgi:hypothetical protein